MNAPIGRAGGARAKEGINKKAKRYSKEGGYDLWESRREKTLEDHTKEGKGEGHQKKMGTTTRNPTGKKLKEAKKNLR